MLFAALALCALPFALPFTERTPEVLAFPLSFVSTAVFDGAVLLFMFAGTLHGHVTDEAGGEMIDGDEPGNRPPAGAPLRDESGRGVTRGDGSARPPGNANYYTPIAEH